MLKLLKRFDGLYRTSLGVFLYHLIFLSKVEENFTWQVSRAEKSCVMSKEKVVECLSSFPFIAWEFLSLSIINSRHSSCQLSVSMLSLSVSMLSVVRFYAVSAFQAHSKVLKIEFPHSWLSIKSGKSRKISGALGEKTQGSWNVRIKWIGEFLYMS